MKPLLIIVLTFLVTVASYWLTIGALSLASWMGHGTFAMIIGGWSGFQFLVVTLLGSGKHKKGYHGEASY